MEDKCNFDVKELPNIILTSERRYKLAKDIDRYLKSKYPVPDSSGIAEWLEKTGNETFPDDHRALLGCDGYNLGCKQFFNLQIFLDEYGCAKVRPTEYQNEEDIFKVKIFYFYNKPFNEEALPVKYINQKILEDKTGIILKYIKKIEKRKDILYRVRSTWCEVIWRTKNSKDLPEQYQIILKNYIMDTFDKDSEAFQEIINNC